MPTLPGKRKSEAVKNLDAPPVSITEFSNVGELTEYLDHEPHEAPNLLAQEEEGKARVTWLDVLRPLAEAETARRADAGHDDEPESKKLPTMKERMRHGVQGAESVSERLMKEWKPTQVDLMHEERLKNKALPNNFFAVDDWPEDFAKKWVPCPPRTREFHPAEAANLEGMQRAGWRFFDSQMFDTKPNAHGHPYKTGVEFEGSKVRFLDHWLMYKPVDYDERVRRENLRRWNETRQGRKEPGRHTRETEGGSYEYVVHSESGEAAVSRLLRESESNLDEQDRAWTPE